MTREPVPAGMTAPDRRSPRVLAGRYRMDYCLAIGATGEVWRAEDLVMRRPVAVKLVRAEFAAGPDAAAMFRAEARCLARLSHPGITRVYDYQAAAPPFLVMELVDGPSLALVLVAGPLAPWRALDVIAQAARALQASHAAGIIHRDVKPANIVLTAGVQVKLTDFGIAHTARPGRLTALGPVLGTPAYLAPERIAGRSASPASDLYSLGVVLYECLTGTRPFSGTATDLAFAHQRLPFPPLPQPVLPRISALLAGLTAKEPQARPPSAGMVASRAAALRDELLFQITTESKRALPPASAAPKPTRPRLIDGWAGPASRFAIHAGLISDVTLREDASAKPSSSSRLPKVGLS